MHAATSAAQGCCARPLSGAPERKASASPATPAQRCASCHAARHPCLQPPHSTAALHAELAAVPEPVHAATSQRGPCPCRLRRAACSSCDSCRLPTACTWCGPASSGGTAVQRCARGGGGGWRWQGGRCGARLLTCLSSTADAPSGRQCVSPETWTSQLWLLCHCSLLFHDLSRASFCAVGTCVPGPLPSLGTCSSDVCRPLRSLPALLHCRRQHFGSCLRAWRHQGLQQRGLRQRGQIVMQVHRCHPASTYVTAAAGGGCHTSGPALRVQFTVEVPTRLLQHFEAAALEQPVQ